MNFWKIGGSFEKKVHKVGLKMPSKKKANLADIQSSRFW